MTQANKRSERIGLAFAIVPAVLVIGWFAKPYLSNDPATVQAALNDPTAAATGISDPRAATVEYKIASLENGGPVMFDDVRVARLGEDLDALQKRYPKSRTEIGDIFFTAHKLLVERGYRDESIADLMEWVLREAPPELKNLNGIATLYVIGKTQRR